MAISNSSEVMDGSALNCTNDSGSILSPQSGSSSQSQSLQSV